MFFFLLLCHHSLFVITAEKLQYFRFLYDCNIKFLIHPSPYCLQYLRKISVMGHRVFLIYAVCLLFTNPHFIIVSLLLIFEHISCYANCTFFEYNLPIFWCQVPLGLAITWATAFLLTEAGVYNYKGCDVNVPASNMISEHCRKHVSRMKHCRVDTSHALKSSPWFRFPYPLQWGTPVFHWKMAIVMCVVSVISSVDSVSLLPFVIFNLLNVHILYLIY